MSTVLACPGCGTETTIADVRRDADAFCATCDYPLFWAPVAVRMAGTAAGAGAGLRRLPGTAGHVADASYPCPACHEPNGMTAVVCIRCGAELHPAPVVEAPPPPPPPPPPEPEPVPAPKRWSVIQLVLIGLEVLALIVVVALLVHYLR